MYAVGMSPTTTHTMTSASGWLGMSAQRNTPSTRCFANTGVTLCTRATHGCAARNARASSASAATEPESPDASGVRGTQAPEEGLRVGEEQPVAGQQLCRHARLVAKEREQHMLDAL